eukprot:scaffold2566_cov54-Phaeocystis_antarctica.AAC.2
MLLMVVTLDVSKLSGWLKAIAPCRVEKEAYSESEMRVGDGRACDVRHKAGCRRTRLETRGRGWAMNTKNIWLMSVTPEVSQPEMSALNAVKSLKSWYMLVIAETSQPEVGPYAADPSTRLGP